MLSVRSAVKSDLREIHFILRDIFNTCAGGEQFDRCRFHGMLAGGLCRTFLLKESRHVQSYTIDHRTRMTLLEATSWP